MDWIKNLNNTLEFIENNITKELNNEIVAKEALSSNSHFHRVFNVLTGKTLGEYIKERRLTLASQDITSKKLKIIEVAHKYGYKEQASFIKAFKRFHGVTPTQALNSNTNLKATPPLNFVIDIRGEDQIDFRIKKRESFTVIGTSLNTTIKNEINSKEVPQFWQDKIADGTISQIISKSKDKGCLGIGYNYNVNIKVFDWIVDDFTYMIATEQNDNITSDKLTETLTIPESTWAIFPGKGLVPSSLQNLWKRIYLEWFPATNYEQAKGPYLELILSQDDEDGIVEFEIWIPVKHEI